MVSKTPHPINIAITSNNHNPDILPIKIVKKQGTIANTKSITTSTQVNHPNTFV
ncbi:MAG: hypothetical protein MJ223_02810 [Mycoplasmoidaceae bacterium]|nr:hypothetical protein [Mycoplasmoidaceae bacterium]